MKNNFYDLEAERVDWIAPEITYNLLSNKIRCGDNILDIGIGTGLSSIRLRNKGAQIYGLDNSEEMIEICKAKRFAALLMKYDISKPNYPFKNDFFDIALSIGVLHFFRDLSAIFNETTRILKKFAYFAFTFGCKNKQKTDFILASGDSISNEEIKLFFHDTEYILDLAAFNSLKIISSTDFIVYMNNEKSKFYNARICLAQKKI